MQDIDYNNLNIQVDEEFWNDFIQEALEHVDSIELNIFTLEKEPDNMEIIHSMFRAYHTIKGLAGFVEHTIIQELAHKTETVMDYCRQGQAGVTPDVINAILKTADFIKVLCNEIDAWQDKDLVSEIKTHIEHLKSLNQVIEVDIEENDIQPNNVLNEHQIDYDYFEEFFADLKKQREEETLDSDASLEDKEPETKKKKAKKETKKEIKKVEKDDIKKTDKKKQEQEVLEIVKTEEIEAKEEIKKEEVSPTYVSPSDLKNVDKKIDNTALKQEQQPQIESTPSLKAEASSSVQKKPVVEEYMKVANSKIDSLVDGIGELITNQSFFKEHILQNYSHDIVFTKNLDDTIVELKKDVDFISSGDETEIDRVVADKLLEPLIHLIKNAIAHGIESNPNDRTIAGKPQKGQVRLEAYNKRGKIFIDIIDDGKGIDTNKVLAKAIEKGLVESDKEYSNEEIQEFILLPNFSTADKVDNISGRGVGMDVVQTQIQKIGGKISIKSEAGKGSTFTLEVPVNYAIMNGILIDIEEQRFIVPTVNVREIILIDEKSWICTNGKRTMYNLRDEIMPIVKLSKFYKNADENQDFPYALVLEVDNDFRILPITGITGRQEVVVKPLEEEFSNLKYLSGMSILGNGSISLILDVNFMYDN